MEERAKKLTRFHNFTRANTPGTDVFPDNTSPFKNADSLNVRTPLLFRLLMRMTHIKPELY
jgi:hypothetical protein